MTTRRGTAPGNGDLQPLIGAGNTGDRHAPVRRLMPLPRMRMRPDGGRGSGIALSTR
jgi:hypothetical protein